MRAFGWFVLGALAGGWGAHSYSLPGHRGGGEIAYLNGGSLTSSTVGVIYGYVNDMEGCSVHAAGANFYYASNDETKARIMKTIGNSYCSREAQ
jgi:hypothetical protein